MESVVKEEEFLTKDEIKSVIKEIIENHYRYISSSGITFKEIEADFLYWLEKNHRKCNWSLEPILNELIRKGEVVIQGTTLDDRLTFRLFHRPIK